MELSLACTVVLLFSVTGSVNGLRCYTCTYGAPSSPANNPQCADPFVKNTDAPLVLNLECVNVSRLAPEATIQAGIRKFDVCMKTTKSSSDQDVISRTCYDSSQCPTTNGCYSEAGSTVCCCNTDLCNRAAALASNLAFAVALACAVFKLAV